MTISDLGTVFHEMGHIYYFMLYADLPRVFRAGANAAAEAQHQLALTFDHVGRLFHGIATSKWMWTVLDEPVSRERMDSIYWDMRLKYEGIRSPLNSQTSNFRSPADYDFLGHVNRIRSMCSLVVQMQIIQYLCRGVNHTGRLRECDIFGSEEAGRRLTSILKLGSSKPFSHVMKIISEGRQESIDATATLEYFLASLERLEDISERYVGWGQ